VGVGSGSVGRSEVRIRGSGSVPKCHGSATLVPILPLPPRLSQPDCPPSGTRAKMEPNKTTAKECLPRPLYFLYMFRECASRLNFWYMPRLSLQVHIFTPFLASFLLFQLRRTVLPFYLSCLPTCVFRRIQLRFPH
jgi:hypothetical protein